MVKKYKTKSVYEAFIQRISYIFKCFDHVIISFSGGKDSGVMLELVYTYYQTHLAEMIGKKVSVFHLDYEGNYRQTDEYVKRCMGKYDEFDYYHICLPISASCGISMSQPTWMPWDPDQKELWIKPIPNNSISLENHEFPFFEIGMSDYIFQKKFCQWLHQKSGVKRTAILIGIRAQESINRYNAVTRKETFSKFDTIPYSTRVAPDIFNFYPLYDWQFEDIWVANNRFKFDYNRLYDLYFQAGVSFKEMRVANPFHQSGVSALKLYRAIEPETWGKLIGRVNGVNFSALYGGTSAMGYRDIKLPPGHTWKTYVDFLLSTLPADVKEIFLKKFDKSIKYWTQKGGGVPSKIVQEMDPTHFEFEKLGPPNNQRKYKQRYEIIRFKTYPDDVSTKNFRLLPSYKRMCITILKNDTACQYMGFSRTKNELQMQREAKKIWKNIS